MLSTGGRFLLLRLGESLTVRRSQAVAPPLLASDLGWDPSWVRVGCVTYSRFLYLMELPSLSMWMPLPPKVVWQIERGNEGNVCGTQ